MTPEIKLVNASELIEALSPVLRRLVRESLLLELTRNDSKSFLTQDEVSELTGWSKRQLAYKRQTRSIPYCKRGRTVWYRAEDVYDWIEEGYVPASGGHDNV